ncbi:hypothetical protein IQ07DRAFT_583873 [Pyrenochaeta sp. DS3sAY3a]|nr:hypothetical protein IQ07DRAFT_583873 [Pyrenochaeta sp. DS3sAY3a]
MALARLEEQIPDEDTANQRASTGLGAALRLRQVFGEVLGHFHSILGDGHYQTWVNSEYRWGRNTIFMLLEAIADCDEEIFPQGTLNHATGYYLDIMMAFHNALFLGPGGVEIQRWTAEELSVAVAEEVGQIIGTVTDDLVKSWIEMDPRALTPAQVNEFVLGQLGRVSIAIEDYVRDQWLLRWIANYDTDGEIGEGFASTVQLRFRDTILSSIRKLIARVDQHRHLPDPYLQSQDDIRDFFADIATLFNWNTPIFRVPRTVMQVIPPSPFTDLGTAELDDEPETWLRSDMTLEVVSNEVDNAENDCPICAEKPAKMQRLKQCGHQFCKECLDTQMHTDIQSNYKCSLCRKPMKPMILNGVPQL